MIYVVRHGQTDLNREGRLQGRRGAPLNEVGIEQARRLRDRLEHVHFDYVYSSPQERAVQTAEIATGRPIVVDDRLDVFDLGEADRLKREEVKLDGVIPDAKIYRGVEEVDGFVHRIFSFMHELQAKHAGSEVNILIAGHRCTTGCIGAYFQGMPDDGNILRLSSGNGEFRTYAITQ